MHLRLLNMLCDPIDKSELELIEPVYENCRIVSGTLLSRTGHEYRIIDGIPRFQKDISDSVRSFGDEWNYFNYDDFRVNWLNHVVKNTFGSTEVFKNKIVVDCGAGSGMQSLWMSEAGAEYVISLELSHSVDSVMKHNLNNATNIDVIQCSIDNPPLKDDCISGIVICHNVIQHTPSVDVTAKALYRIVADKGEFVFNCYIKRERNKLWMLRFHFYILLRRFFSSKSFRMLLYYSLVMSLLRFIPILGYFIEKSLLMIRGDIPKGPHHFCRSFKAGVMNTFDWYGSHSYQHHKTEYELRNLINDLQPDGSKVFNLDKYFERSPHIGCAFRIFK